MTNEPHIFVGTMSCGEGDFAACCQAIASQEGVKVDHLVIENLSEKDAHNKLWASWRERQSSFDLFVKIDADTVLITQHTLRQIWELFRDNSRLTGVQAPLHDYMTNGFINGLNCFSPKVTFNDTRDELYCDRKVDTNHDITLSSENVPGYLRPAGLHCHHANEAQSFHYGLHRALKKQIENLARVQAAWEQFHDQPRRLVLEGASLAPLFEKNKWGFNYADASFKDALRATLDKLNRT